jgi:acyl dehydratase
MFGGLSASGWHTAAVTMRLLAAPERLENLSRMIPFVP